MDPATIPISQENLSFALPNAPQFPFHFHPSRVSPTIGGRKKGQGKMTEPPPEQRTRKKGKRGERSSAAARFAALPPDVRERILALLPYWDVIQLYGVCRAWRRLRLHTTTPVVDIDLRDLLMVDGCTIYEAAIYGLRVALGDERRSRPVEMLDLTYCSGDRDMRTHADNLMERVQPHRIRISLARSCALTTGELLDAFFRRLDRWVMYVPFLAGELELRGGDHRVPMIDGTGAELLDVLSLSQAVLKDAPRLRSLRSLTLSGVTVAVPLVPGEWCPLLERLRIEDCRVERRAVVVLLPRLKLLAMEDVDVGSAGREDAPFGDVAVDAPELEELAVSCSTRWAVDYRSFAQFAQCVRVDVGNPGSVSEGTIEFTANGECEMKLFRAQMMKMLRGLLPDLTPNSIADVARPYMKLDIRTTVDEDTGGEVIQEEKLTCDIGGLLMSRPT
ncbi:hypothetical protein PVAP13_3NG060200 [Panicum virgatum]|uniref:F-box domain-containing protein n=1 Tax=Panicum virgatum TaxID=38727 RepID=A0A8T0TX74_PANVG|nr:hypothetical protein PVAP13_3NG060200 [Panicum virgatum]